MYKYQKAGEEDIEMAITQGLGGSSSCHIVTTRFHIVKATGMYHAKIPKFSNMSI
jgi:hypothetical protein